MRYAVKSLRIRPAYALLIICLMIVVSLAFLTARLGDFTDSIGPNNQRLPNNVIHGESELNPYKEGFNGDTEKLKALQQESGRAFRKPVGIIYQEESSTSDSKPIVQSLDNGNTRLDNVTKNLPIPRRKQAARQKNNKSIPDAFIRHMRDQLIRAKLYLNLASANNNGHIIRELRIRMKELGRGLGDAVIDADLSRRAIERMKSMERTLSKANSMCNDCPTKLKKIRAMLHSMEEQLQAQKKQGAFLNHVALTSFSKGAHCLSMRLTMEYFDLNPMKRVFPYKEKLEDPTLLHYAIFSDNVLATSVVVNSTIFNAREPENIVFHIITDNLNHAAMKMWFLSNPPGDAVLEVRNVEEIGELNFLHSPIIKWIESAHIKEEQPDVVPRDSSKGSINLASSDFRLLDHLQFYLPEIFPKLRKVIILDDDVVVQKDLTTLWSINLHGKVNGAVKLCGDGLYRLDRYFNFSDPLIQKNFDSNSCTWASGMNIFDLQAWRKGNITSIYHRWQDLNKNGQLWKLSTVPRVPVKMLIFYNNTYSIPKHWHVVGLGYDGMLNQADIEKAAVIHYAGNLKPWLEIGISKYRPYWTKYLKQDHIFLQHCNLVL